MSKLALASPSDDDLPSRLGLQSPRSWGSTWHNSIDYDNSFKSQLQNAGLGDDDANQMVGILSNDINGSGRSASDNEFTAFCASEIGGIEAIDPDDDLSTEYAFTKALAGDRFSDLVGAESCPEGVCSLSDDDLAFLDALNDGGEL
jgi:hypothetical protein